MKEKEKVELSEKMMMSFLEIQVDTLKVYTTEELLAKGKFFLLLYDGLKRNVVMHHIDNRERLVSFGNQFIKLDEWAVFPIIRPSREIVLEIKNIRGVNTSYIPNLKIEISGYRGLSLEAEHKIFSVLEKLAEKYFHILAETLNSNISDEFLATKEEFLAHTGEIDPTTLK